MTAHDASAVLVRILKAVAWEWGVEAKEVVGRTREEPVITARLAWYYLAVKYAGVSSSTAGLHIGRDHKSVLSGVRTATEIMDTSPAFREAVTNVFARLAREDSRGGAGTCGREPAAEIALRIANMTAEDQRFFQNVVELFCDPAHSRRLAMFRAGRERLVYDGRGGMALQMIEGE